MKKHFPIVMSIAGSDSGGCAGIQADLKTFSALGCFGTTAITAVTAQNTTGVKDIHNVSIETLQNQISAVLDDMNVRAIKVGMLANSKVINVVSDLLGVYKVKNVVLDPVMVAASGDVLLEKDAIKTLIHQLIPQAMIITPNTEEAGVLLNREVNKQKDFARSARDLCDFGCRSVLLKAGHLEDKVLVDVFYDKISDQLVELESERIETRNTHGTGCTLSSAIAAFLSRGEELENAVRYAKDYLIGALKAGSEYQVGKGNGPVHHFHAVW